MEYEINSSTMAIIPIDENTSKVYEEEDEYIIKKSSNGIIKENCEFYGSSYEGRCIGTKSLTGIKTKYPIIIEDESTKGLIT
jgi:competence protein ComK